MINENKWRFYIDMKEMCRECNKISDSSTETVVREIGTFKFETECPHCHAINSMIDLNNWLYADIDEIIDMC